MPRTARTRMTKKEYAASRRTNLGNKKPYSVLKNKNSFDTIVDLSISAEIASRDLDSEVSMHSDCSASRAFRANRDTVSAISACRSCNHYIRENKELRKTIAHKNRVIGYGLRRLAPSYGFTSRSPVQKAETIATETFRKVEMKPFSQTKNWYSKQKRVKAAVRILGSIAAEDDIKSFLIAIQNYGNTKHSDWSFSVTPSQAMHLKSILKMSNLDLSRLKSTIRRCCGFDFLPDTKSIVSAEKNISKKYEYRNNTTKLLKTGGIPDIDVSLSNVDVVLQYRIQKLFDSKVIDESDTPVKVTVVGDTGAGTTKVGLAIMEGDETNSTNNLTVLSIYSGKDNYEQLDLHLRDVCSSLAGLKSVKILNETGNTIQKMLEFFLTGDCTFLCASCGHKGPNAVFFCVMCYFERTTNGQRVLVKDLDLSKISEARTLQSYEEDSQSVTSVRGVNVGTTLIFGFIPIIRFIPPSLHIFMGFVDKYIFHSIIRFGMIADCHTDTEILVLMNLMSETEAEESLITDLEIQKSLLDVCDKDLKTVAIVCEAWRSINQINGYYKPRLPCSASFCLKSELRARGFTTFHSMCNCNTCGQRMHYECCGLISISQIEKAENDPDSIKCYKCNGFPYGKDILPVVEAELLKVSLEQSTVLGELKKIEASLNSQASGAPTKGDCCQALDHVMYDDLKLLRKSFHGGSFNGNDTKKFLKRENVEKIIGVLERQKNLDSFQTEIASLKNLMLLTSELMSAASADVTFDAQKIHDLSVLINDFLKQLKICCPDMTVTPKLHMLLFHVLPFIKSFGHWGKTSEQIIEHFHSEFALAERSKAPIADPISRYNVILADFACRNHFHDTRGTESH